MIFRILSPDLPITAISLYTGGQTDVSEIKTAA